jgi:hypothetical protein
VKKSQNHVTFLGSQNAPSKTPDSPHIAAATASLSSAATRKWSLSRLDCKTGFQVGMPKSEECFELAAVRGLTKSWEHRMPASSTPFFAKRSLAVMPPGLAQALGPVLEQIAEMTLKIKQHDRQIQQLGQTEYPKTQALLKVHGVGHITALT